MIHMFKLDAATYQPPNAVPMRRVERAAVVVTLIAIMRGKTIESFEIGVREPGGSVEIAATYFEEDLDAACRGHEALDAFLTALDTW